MVDDLRGAVVRRELVAHYQPQVALPGRRVVAVEALARWNHPEFGLIAPSDFIPVAERAGLINIVGQHILEIAVEEVGRWSADGLVLDLSVNVSPTQLAGSDYCQIVAGVLDRAGLDPEVLTIEITETEPIADLPAVVDCLDHIRELGVGVSIDDFGVGHTSLEQLRSIPATELKLDQSIIQGDVDVALEVLDEVLAEARSRGIRVVAEGVETVPQLALAMRLQCERAQGYLLGKPMSGDALKRSLI